MKSTVCVLLTITGLLQLGTPAQTHVVYFSGFSGDGPQNKAATLYSGDLPTGAWIIQDLIQRGVSQELGGFNNDETIVDNAIAIEANGKRYGLIHRYDGLGIYDGVPYTNQVLSGSIEISLWEAHLGSAAAAAAGRLVMVKVNPELSAEMCAQGIVLAWSQERRDFSLQCTDNLIHGTWLTVGDTTPVIIGGQCVCTNITDQQQRYYRLSFE